MALRPSQTHSGRDTDDDYGYDLSLEEERTLIALTARIRPAPAPAPAPHPTPSLRAGLRSGWSSARHTSSAVEDDIEFSFGGAASSITDLEISRESPLDAPDLAPGPTDHAPVLFAHALWSAAPAAPPLAPVDDTLSGEGLYRHRAPFVSLPGAIRSEGIHYPDLSGALSQLPVEPHPQSVATAAGSPLERFRSYPKKPLSVTDLTSGAWCELQYEYTLTRLPGGKKTQTRAMKEGTKVHKKLEDQVHTTVEVSVSSKEDLFGLRIWNVIQGLRTLRETGLTREVEVWGLVNGNVVNGLIDGLTYRNPDPDFEHEYLSSQDSRASSQQKKASRRKVYLVDVKTRGSKSLPSGTAVRPTKVQLFLYHRFLSQMACGELDYQYVFRRYGLDAERPFSDEFIAQIGSLHTDLFADARPGAQSAASSRTRGTSSSQSSSGVWDLIRYRNLRELTRLLISELKLTFPAGAESIGPLVTAEYRSRPTRSTTEQGDETIVEEGGAVVGQNVFAVDDGSLDRFLAENMQWWDGKRKAQGVDIEEAFKCRSCEFAEICTWRKEMDENNLRRARERLAARDRKNDPTEG